MVDFSEVVCELEGVWDISQGRTVYWLILVSVILKFSDSAIIALN
jgi:hypothetical protein